MLNLKSLIKEDEINGLNANQETATWKRATVEISSNLQWTVIELHLDK